MKTIEIENSVFQALARKAVGFGVTPNDVIKTLLNEESPNAGLAQPNPSPGPANEPKTDRETHPLAVLVDSPDYMRRDCKGRYFAVLQFLYENDKGEFAKLDNYRKGSRVQISTNKDAIEKSGRNTWPQILDGTPYWVLTNLSNYRKRDILDDILRILRYPNDVITLVVNSIPDVGNARLLRKYV